jgi:RimJ/RimL family protein N-acetyltransferase
MSDPARGMIEIPVLDSERLRLRGHRPSDYEDSAAMWSDEAVVRHIGGKPATREEVWARILRYVGHWAWLGYGMWVVEEKATGMFAGEVGYTNNKREIQPPLMDRPELGWVLASSFHGKGYATEAVRVAEAWGDKRFGKEPTVCIVHADNERSIRVAEKCGFKEPARTTYKGQATIVFTREPQK